MMIFRVIFMISVVQLLTACGGPSGWAEELETHAKCGMSIDEVQKLADNRVVKKDTPRDWVTHMIRDGDTDVWLSFDSDGLISMQIAWTEKMMKVATYQRVILCPSVTSEIRGLPWNSQSSEFW